MPRLRIKKSIERIAVALTQFAPEAGLPRVVANL
jgi:hypothetical protein